jgi:hypothetical protein
MIRAQCLLPDRQGAYVEGLGLGVSALVGVQPREIVEASGGVGMIGPSAFSLIARARM